MKRPATGVALAWLILVAAIPYGGALIYLMIGERRVGDLRTRRIDRTGCHRVACSLAGGACYEPATE